MNYESHCRHCGHQTGAHYDSCRLVLHEDQVDPQVMVGYDEWGFPVYAEDVV